MLELRSWQRADRLWFNLGFLKKPGGLAGALACHAAVGLLLFHYSHAVIPFQLPQDGSRGLKLFTLPQEGEKQEPPAPETKAASGGAPAAKAAVAEVQDSPVAPAEWTVSRIRVARAAAVQSPATAALPGPSVPAPPSGSSGAGSSSGFDPYAGASPRRPGEMRVSLSPGNGTAPRGPTGPGGPPSPGNAALQAFLIRELRLRFPELRGSFLLAAQFDRRGQIADIIVRQGQIDRSALRWLRGRLRSAEELMTGTAAPGSLVDLPEVHLL
jgi:hypothetical protein